LSPIEAMSGWLGTAPPREAKTLIGIPSIRCAERRDEHN